MANDIDIFYRRSTDGAKTWSDHKVLNDDDPAMIFPQGIPNMAIAPNGRVDIGWWDLRNDPGITFGNDVYCASSVDNGTTWSKNIRITDQLIDRRIGVFGNNFDVSGPPGLASSNAFALFGWDDTRNAKPGELGAGTQDLFTAAAQYKAVSTGTSRIVKVALAAVAGLVLVGLVLFVAALGARGRTGPPQGEPRLAGRTRSGVG